MVLVEFLDDAAGQGSYRRDAAARFAAGLRNESTVLIERQSAELFDSALELYIARPDKRWSLTDCASMVLCKRLAITDVLTHDRHFVQAGYKALLRDD